MKTKFFGLLILLITAVSAVNAQTACQRKNLNGYHQKERIRQGVRSGEVNRLEARQLRRQQRDIAIAKQTARADGKISRAEKRHIKKMKRNASGNIYRKKHNLR